MSYIQVRYSDENPVELGVRSNLSRHDALEGEVVCDGLHEGEHALRLAVEDRHLNDRRHNWLTAYVFSDFILTFG